jgi:transposase InsO family protein
MGQVLHGSAATTHAVRAAIQRSTASVAALSRKYGVNPKTVAKWRQRDGVSDAPMGPKEPRSTVLSKEEEALAVAFRRHTLLPLDDCLYALQATIPHMTRSSLHRLFQRHDISRLPDVEGSKPKRAFKTYPIGFFHIDIAEVWTEEGKLYMLVAVDRTSKFAFAELHERATRRVAADFLRRLIAAVPYSIHTVLTDNGTHFTDPKGNGWTAAEVKQLLAEAALFRCHSFALACARNDIDHRLTKPHHPWTNGQVERMNRTIKDATVRLHHYESHDRLREHLKAFLDAYNFAKRLKTLKGLTVFEFISAKWQSEPERFTHHPDHLIPGLNT